MSLEYLVLESKEFLKEWSRQTSETYPGFRWKRLQRDKSSIVWVSETNNRRSTPFDKMEKTMSPNWYKWIINICIHRRERIVLLFCNRISTNKYRRNEEIMLSLCCTYHSSDWLSQELSICATTSKLNLMRSFTLTHSIKVSINNKRNRYKFYIGKM